MRGVPKSVEMLMYFRLHQGVRDQFPQLYGRKYRNNIGENIMVPIGAQGLMRDQPSNMQWINYL